MTFFARYELLNVILKDTEDNSETIAAYQDMLTNSVTLQGRTFYRDGTWNTLCLPFNVDNLNGTPLEGATVKMLVSTAYEASTSTLRLNFSDNLQSLSAGMPYIVKWEGESDNISNPTFNNVTLSNYTDCVETDEVTFCGTFSPITLVANDKTKLYLGAGNKLYYPNGDMNINACRAYFQLNGLTAGEPTSLAKVSNFVVNFGDGESTGISLTPSLSTKGKESRSWYDLQGRQLNGKPATKGMYIKDGRKVVIK